MLLTHRHCLDRKKRADLLSTLTSITPDIPLPYCIQSFALPLGSDLLNCKAFIFAIVPFHEVVGYIGGRPFGEAGEEEIEGPSGSLPGTDKDFCQTGWLDELIRAYKDRRRGRDLRNAFRSEINVGDTRVAARFCP